MRRSGDAPEFDEAHRRARMVERQLIARGIADPRVLDAMREVPRERFVPAAWRREAYHDGPLPIGARQTISQPYIVALMLEAARIGPDDRVLEVGAGSGYAAALCGRLAAHVMAIERIGELARSARARLAGLGCTNVEVHCADGSLGWPAGAPYDAILVAAGGPDVPPALRAQLRIGGRLVMPIGATADGQRLVRIVRTAVDAQTEETLCAVSFVPLIGEAAWPEAGAT